MRRRTPLLVLAALAVMLAGCSTLSGGQTEANTPQTDVPEDTEAPGTASDSAGASNDAAGNDSVSLPESWQTPTERETPPPMPDATDVEGTPPPVDDQPDLTPTPAPEPTPTPTPAPSVDASDLDISVEPRVETVHQETGGVERVYHLEGEVSNPTNHSVEFEIYADAQTEGGRVILGEGGGERLTPGEDTPVSWEYSPAGDVLDHDIRTSVTLSDG